MKTIKQNHTINAPVEEVYIALVNPLTIELWSGYPAKMEKIPGTEFSIFDGDIEGKNIDFIENELVKQEWYFGEENPSSIVTIKLRGTKKNDKTEIELIHENVPDDVYDEMLLGWKREYWGAIKSYFK